MNLLDYRCPNCNAALRIDPDWTSFNCEYCGSKLYREQSYDLFDEQNIEKSNTAMANKNAKLIQQYISHFESLDKMQKRRAHLLSEKCEDPDNDTFWKKYGMYIVPGIFLMSFISSLARGHMDIMLFMSYLAIIVITYFALGHQRIAKVKKYNSITSELKQLDSKIAEKSKEFNVEAVPKNYRNMDALQYFNELFTTQRAYTMQQAIMLYNEKLLYSQKEHGHTTVMTGQSNAQQQLTKTNIQSSPPTVSDNRSEEIGVGIAAGIVTGLAMTKKIVKEINKLK